MRRNVSKSVLSIILAGALAFSAAGCSKKKDERTSRKKDNDATEATTTKQLDAPSGLAWDYNPDTGCITFSWQPVTGAKEYEFCKDNETPQTTQNTCYPMIYSSSKTGTLQVRAVDGDNKSGWSNIAFDYSVYPAAPTNFRSTTYGQYQIVYWDPVDGANGYEFRLASGTSFTKASKPYCLVQMQDGASATIEVRACNTVGAKQYNSAMKKCTVSQPVVDLSQVIDKGSCVLDYNRLIEWIKLNKYTYSTNKANGYVYVVVSMKDDQNSGFLNALGRMIEAYLDSFADNVPSALQDNLGDLIFGGQPAKDYLKSSLNDAEKSGIIGAIGAAFADTSINYIYRFGENDLDCPPKEVLMYYLKNNRPEQNFRNTLSANGKSIWGQNGYCYVYTPISESEKLCVARSLESDGKYWVVRTLRTDEDKSSPIAMTS